MIKITIIIIIALVVAHHINVRRRYTRAIKRRMRDALRNFPESKKED